MQRGPYCGVLQRVLSRYAGLAPLWSQFGLRRAYSDRAMTGPARKGARGIARRGLVESLSRSRPAMSRRSRAFIPSRRSAAAVDMQRGPYCGVLQRLLSRYAGLAPLRSQFGLCRACSDRAMTGPARKGALNRAVRQRKGPTSCDVGPSYIPGIGESRDAKLIASVRRHPTC